MNQKKNAVVRPIHIALSVCIIGVVSLGIGVSASVRSLQVKSDKAASVAVNTENATYETMLADETVEETETKSATATLTYPKKSSEVKELDENLILSDYAVLIDISKNEIIAQRSPEEKLYPASMSKIMTLIVALEHLSDLDMTFTMTDDIINPLAVQGAAMAGFKSGESVTVRDLLYACALPSGAEATTALAILVSGSEADFVELMNQKAVELGLINTHYTNCTGLHDDNHYTTAVDMALLIEYAMQNEDLKEILSTYQYTTTSTDLNPSGILLESTVFSKMYGNEVDGITIIAGKTGFTDQAGYCLVSYAEDEENNPYVCVAAKSEGTKGAVYDTLNIYGTINDGYYSPTTTPAPETETNKTYQTEIETQIIYEDVPAETEIVTEIVTEYIDVPLQETQQPAADPAAAETQAAEPVQEAADPAGADQVQPAE